MLVLNEIYSFFIHWVHLLLNLLPGFLRSLVFRLLLCKAGKKLFIDHEVFIKFPWLMEVGSQVSINRGAVFFPSMIEGYKIILGSHVVIAPNVSFYAAGPDPDHPSGYRGGEIRVGDYVWIGASSLILPGVCIGEGSIVGAGSVVIKDIPPRSVAAGVPAKVLRPRTAQDKVL